MKIFIYLFNNSAKEFRMVTGKSGICASITDFIFSSNMQLWSISSMKLYIIYAQHKEINYTLRLVIMLQGRIIISLFTGKGILKGVGRVRN